MSMQAIPASQLCSLAIIGVGGQGVVAKGYLKGVDGGLATGADAEGQQVAVKVSQGSRFLHEIGLQACFPHSGIVRVLGTCQLPAQRLQQLLQQYCAQLQQQGRKPPAKLPAFTVGDQGAQPPVLAAVMEYCDGGSLGDLLRQQHALRKAGGGQHVYMRRDALRWLLTVAQAMAYLHGGRPKLIHRDIKADNILLYVSFSSGKREAKLADMGLTAMVHASGHKLDPRRGLPARPPTLPATATSGDSTPSGGSRQQTPPGIGADSVPGMGVAHQASASHAAAAAEVYQLTGRCGSLLYMAPEMLQQQPYNEAVDVFSFGLLAWELLSGCPLEATLPLSLDDYLGRAFAMAHEGWRPQMPAGLPPRLAQMVRECWHEQWQRRPASAELVCDLAALLAAAAPESQPQRAGFDSPAGRKQVRSPQAAGGRAASGTGSPQLPAGQVGALRTQRMFGQEMEWVPPGFETLNTVAKAFRGLSFGPSCTGSRDV